MLSDTEYVLIAVGCVIVVLVLAAVVIILYDCFIRRRRNKNLRENNAQSQTSNVYTVEVPIELDLENQPRSSPSLHSGHHHYPTVTPSPPTPRRQQNEIQIEILTLQIPREEYEQPLPSHVETTESVTSFPSTIGAESHERENCIDSILESLTDQRQQKQQQKILPKPYNDHDKNDDNDDNYEDDDDNDDFNAEENDDDKKWNHSLSTSTVVAPSPPAEKEYDLHGMRVREAMALVEDVLEMEALGYNSSCQRIRFITGRGLHSPDGIPAIRNALEDFLDEWEFSYHRENKGGVVVVDLMTMPDDFMWM